MSILGGNRKSDILSLAEQLKGKLPFPFETIAVAVNFSPIQVCNKRGSSYCLLI